MKKLGVLLMIIMLMLTAIPATAAVVNESVFACDTAVDGATVDTAYQREGAGCLKLTVEGGAASVTLAAASAIDMSEVHLRDGAVMLWLYVDTKAAFEKLSVKLLAEDGKYYLWKLSKYSDSFTEGKWNLMALPFKEFSEETIVPTVDDKKIPANADHSKLTSVVISGAELGTATVYVDDVRLLDYTTYLRENHGILFFDSFEIDSLWATTYTDDAASGDRAVDMDIDAARGDLYYMNSEYVEDEYTKGGIAYPLFTKQDALNLSGANAQTLDVYWKAKVTGDKSKISALSVHMSNMSGDYMDIYSYEMNPSDLTEEYQRFTSYRSKNFSIVSVPGAQLNPKKVVAFRLYMNTGSPKDAKDVSVQIDDLMFVNSKKYTGLADVHCLEAVDLDFDPNATPTTENAGTTSKVPSSTTKPATTTAANGVAETEGDLPIGLIIGIAAAVVVIAAVVVVVVMKKKKA